MPLEIRDGDPKGASLRSSQTDGRLPIKCQSGVFTDDLQCCAEHQVRLIVVGINQALNAQGRTC